MLFRWLAVIEKTVSFVFYLVKSDLRPSQLNPISQTIALFVITLSGFHYSYYDHKCDWQLVLFFNYFKHLLKLPNYLNCMFLVVVEDRFKDGFDIVWIRRAKSFSQKSWNEFRSKDGAECVWTEMHQNWPQCFQSSQQRLPSRCEGKKKSAHIEFHCYRTF